MPSLPEDLVILAVGAKPRGGPDNGKLPRRLCYGMRGAVLVALALAGRVEVAGGQIVVRDPRPLGDVNLDEALAGLAASRAVPVAQWMAGFPAGFVTAYFERLEAAGVLRSETVWLLFMARRNGYRLADPGYFEYLRAAVTGAGPVEPGMAALAGLVHAGAIAQLIYPGRENMALRARLAELAGQDPAMTVPGTRSGTGTSDDPFWHATQAPSTARFTTRSMPPCRPRPPPRITTADHHRAATPPPRTITDGLLCCGYQARSASAWLLSSAGGSQRGGGLGGTRAFSRLRQATGSSSDSA
jgi:Golgi phosphoprotein 3 (GPP34)